MAELADLCVVGAGAAGLWAAGVAARGGRDVLLLEKTARAGTKILASGGARCNLTTTFDPARAARAFRGEGERFLRHAFRVLPPLELRRRFALLGVETIEAPLDKVFPRSGRARDVRDALEREVRAAGVRVRYQAHVSGVERAAEGWRIALAGGEPVLARELALCTGGASYQKSGTTGEGYAWIEALGLPLVRPVPALVPLTSPAAWVRELTGIACGDVLARLCDASGTERGRARRPLVFTHHGVSGPAAMDLSVHVARGQAEEPGARFTLRLDLFPEVEREALHERFQAAASKPGAPAVLSELDGELPRRLLGACARAAGIAQENPRLTGLRRAERHALVEALKGLAIPIDGTTGFEHAEVTSGGLALRAVEPGSMRVRGERGLYVMGELLDLDGPIGGLSFQAAFACAEVAARTLIAER